MKPPTLVVVGRRRPAVAAAKRTGAPVVVLDHTEAGPAIPESLRSAEVSAVLAATERAVLPAARLREALDRRGGPPLPGLAVASADRATDKLAMKQAVRAAGIPCADFLPGGLRATRPAIVGSLGLPLLVKDRRSSGGRGVVLCTRPEDVPEALPGTKLAERIITGIEMSVESFLLDGAILFENPTEYLAPRWANVVPAPIDGPTRAAVSDLNRRVLGALGITSGVTHMELFLPGGPAGLAAGESGPLFGEIAARPPGGHLMELITRAWGFDAWDAWVAAETGAPLPIRNSPPLCTAGMWTLHPGPGMVLRIEGLESARGIEGVREIVLRPQPGDVIAPRVGTGQEIGHIVVEGPDRDAVVRSLDLARERIVITMGGKPA
jgi:biotin carboxylase